jgi:hypothetical protein
VIWTIIAYLVSIGLAAALLFLLLARLVRFFRINIPIWIDDLLDPDGLSELLLPIFSIISYFIARSDTVFAEGWLTTLAAAAALFDLAIILVFAALLILMAAIVLLVLLPLEIVDAIRHRSLRTSLWSLAAWGVVAIAALSFAVLIIPGVSSWSASIARFFGLAGNFASAVWAPITVLSIAAIALIVLFGPLLAHLIFGRADDRETRSSFGPPWNDDELESDSQDRTALREFGRSVASAVAAIQGAVSGGSNGERPVFRGTARRAQAVAAQRESFLRDELRQYRETLPGREVLEVPPTLTESYERRELNEQSANARLVQLLYQVSQEQALLFGRVMDAIGCFVRSAPPASGADPVGAATEVVLRKLRWWERWAGEYQWVVLIRTEQAREFAAFLEPLRNWLGIGIRTAEPAGWNPQRKCAHSDERGTVAGYLTTRSPVVKYAMTCAHVLPAACPHFRITRSGGGQPDAALLHQHPCVDELKGGVHVDFVPNRLLRRLWIAKTSAYRAGGYSNPVPGYVKNLEGGYVAKDGTVEQFPACVVQTRRLRYVWGYLPRPFFRKRFSAEGDSGSWVIVPNAETGGFSWLGMVAAGGEDDNKMESYVLKAGALMLYFRRQLKSERPLIPHLNLDLAEDLAWQAKTTLPSTLYKRSRGAPRQS